MAQCGAGQLAAGVSKRPKNTQLKNLRYLLFRTRGRCGNGGGGALGGGWVCLNLMHAYAMTYDSCILPSLYL